MKKETRVEKETDRRGKRIGYDIFSSRNNNSLVVDAHIHSYMETILMTQCSMDCILGDNGTAVAMTTGDVILIPPNVVHSTVAYPEEGKEMTSICVKFRAQYLYPMEPSAPEISYLLMPTVFREDFYLFRHGTEDADFLGDLIRRIYRVRTGKPLGWELELRGLLCELYCFYLRHCSKRAAENDPAEIDAQSGKTFYEIMTYLQEHFAFSLSMNEVADACGMNYYSFSRFFKKMTGKKFNEYLLEMRLHYARKKLLEDRRPVSDIAITCGFEYASYFIRKFKDRYGLTPREFRQKYNRGDFDEQELAEIEKPMMPVIPAPNATKAPVSATPVDASEFTHCLTD